MSKPLLTAAHVHCHKIACFLISIYLSVSLLAQNSHSVSGTVTDSKKAPLYGVTVLIKGTKKGATTGADGRFILNDVPDNAVLVFSYTGFGAQEISVTGKTSIEVSL